MQYRNTTARFHLLFSMHYTLCRYNSTNIQTKVRTIFASIRKSFLILQNSGFLWLDLLFYLVSYCVSSFFAFGVFFNDYWFIPIPPETNLCLQV